MSLSIYYACIPLNLMSSANPVHTDHHHARKSAVDVWPWRVAGEIRGRRGEGRTDFRRAARGKENRGDLGRGLQDFFLLRHRCFIYRRWWRQAASDGVEQRRRAAPSLLWVYSQWAGFVLGWMAAFVESQAVIELRVKAGTDRSSLGHKNHSPTMSVTAAAKKRGKCQRMGVLTLDEMEKKERFVVLER